MNGEEGAIVRSVSQWIDERHERLHQLRADVGTLRHDGDRLARQNQFPEQLDVGDDGREAGEDVELVDRRNHDRQ